VAVLEPRLAEARASKCTDPGAVVFKTASSRDADT